MDTRKDTKNTQSFIRYSDHAHSRDMLLICLDPAPYLLLCHILFSYALIVAIYRPALSFIIVSSLFLTHGAGSIIITMLSLHNIICNSGSAIKDHPTITPTNITTKLSAPLQSSSNINKFNLLALIDEILSELLFDIERQVESPPGCLALIPLSALTE